MDLPGKTTLNVLSILEMIFTFFLTVLSFLYPVDYPYQRRDYITGDEPDLRVSHAEPSDSTLNSRGGSLASNEMFSL